MQNLIKGIDSNSVRKNLYFLDSISSNHKLNQDSLLLSKLDSVKGNNFFNTIYLNKNKKYKNPSIKYAPSVFSQHLLTSHNKQFAELKENTNDWLLIILLLGFTLFTWIIVSFRKRLKQILNSLFSNRAVNQLIRDGDLLKESITLPLLTIYFLSISLFLLFAIKYYFNQQQSLILNFYIYLEIFISIILLFVLKLIFIRFFSNTFKNQNATFYFLLNGYTTNIILGIILLPLLFLYTFLSPTFANNFLIICLVIIVLFNLFKFIRNLISGFSYSKFPNMYLFLYLCTIEFLPIILLIKLINRFVSF